MEALLPSYVDLQPLTFVHRRKRLSSSSFGLWFLSGILCHSSAVRLYLPNRPADPGRVPLPPRGAPLSLTSLKRRVPLSLPQSIGRSSLEVNLSINLPCHICIRQSPGCLGRQPASGKPSLLSSLSPLVSFRISFGRLRGRLARIFVG